MNPERCASFVRAFIEETAALIGVSLFVATIATWAIALGDIIQ